MADETLILSSPGLVAWDNGEFGENSFGGQALSLGLLQGTATTSIDVTVSVTGTQIVATSGSVTEDISADVPTIGSQINLTIENAVASIPETVTVTGTQINLDEGSVTTDFQPDAGWGNNAWGEVPWGEEDDVTAAVTGTALATFVHPVDTNADGNESVNVDEDDDIIIYLNSVTISAESNVSITGSQINITEGLAGAVITADANVSVTGTQINLTAGNAIGGTIQEVPVTGSQVNLIIGNEIPTADANVNVTGSQINLTIDQVDIAFGYNVTGSRINLITGQVTITGNASVNVTGIRLNLSTGSANVTAWAEVQTGASNTWTPVDLAA